MQINFDSDIIYEANDYIGYTVIEREEFSALVSSFVRTQPSAFSNLKVLFGCLTEEKIDGVHYYLYERTSSAIQRYIDKATLNKPRFHLVHSENGPSTLKPYN